MRGSGQVVVPILVKTPHVPVHDQYDETLDDENYLGLGALPIRGE